MSLGFGGAGSLWLTRLLPVRRTMPPSGLWSLDNLPASGPDRGKLSCGTTLACLHDTLIKVRLKARLRRLDALWRTVQVAAEVYWAAARIAQ